ncbi:MAG: glycosyltransferase family 4 protein [Nitrospinae bacterium]|nr:glycosyltransferase family 4 protein [Nitrospinota bacterium]
MKILWIQRNFSIIGGGLTFAIQFIDELLKEHEVAILTADKKVNSYLKEGIEIIHVPIINFTSILKIFSFAYNAQRIAKSLNYDLILSNEKSIYHDVYFTGDGCHQEYLNTYIKNSQPGKQRRIKLNPKHKLILALEKKAVTCNKLQKIIAFSDNIKNELIKHYQVNEDKIVTIPHGVDCRRLIKIRESLTRWPCRQKLNYPINRLVLLHVGSGFERKNIQIILLALSLMKEKDRPFFVICGKGNQKKLMNLATILKVQDDIRFEGVQTDIYPYYKASDIFILNSWYEPFGLVVLEAMLFGLPVIVSNRCGVSSIVRENKNGYIVKSASEIKRALYNCKDYDTRELMERNNRERVIVNDIRMQVASTLEVISELHEKAKEKNENNM